MLRYNYAYFSSKNLFRSANIQNAAQNLGIGETRVSEYGATRLNWLDNLLRIVASYKTLITD